MITSDHVGIFTISYLLARRVPCSSTSLFVNTRYGVLINHTLQNDAEQEDINVRLKAVVKLWYGVDGASKGTMASGSLPLDTYHRASQVGSGTYGTVVTVYNEEGEQFALKLFVEDDEDGEDENNWASRVIDLGALREISCLRLFRHKNSHQNIIEIADVQTEFDDGSEAGAGTAGCLGMAMPLYSGGSLLAAIAKKSRFSRSIKVSIAHGILSAVAHLHGTYSTISSDWIGTNTDILTQLLLRKRVGSSRYQE